MNEDAAEVLTPNSNENRTEASGSNNSNVQE